MVGEHVRRVPQVYSAHERVDAQAKWVASTMHQ